MLYEELCICLREAWLLLVIGPDIVTNVSLRQPRIVSLALASYSQISVCRSVTTNPPETLFNTTVHAVTARTNTPIPQPLLLPPPTHHPPIPQPPPHTPSHPPIPPQPSAAPTRSTSTEHRSSAPPTPSAPLRASTPSQLRAHQRLVLYFPRQHPQRAARNLRGSTMSACSTDAASQGGGGREGMCGGERVIGLGR